MLKTDAAVLESGIVGKLAQLISCVEGERPVKRRLCIRSEKRTDRCDRRNEERLPFQCAPDVESDPSSWGEYACHFIHRHLSVREILQSLLAQHDIETTHTERQLSRAPLMPFNLRVPASDVQHAFVDINS